MLRRLFLEHPQTVNESYGEHFIQAIIFAGKLFRAAIACTLHGIFPWLFEKTGSTAIVDLHERMVDKRHCQTAIRHERISPISSAKDSE